MASAFIKNKGFFMLKVKNNRSLIAFLLCAITFNSMYTMDQPEKESVLGWVAVIGGVLLGGIAMKYLWQQPGEPFPFTELPQDMQNKIIELASLYSTAESLDIAARTINSLAQVNKELNQKINDPQFCLQLIKHLSKKFNLSNEKVAKKLNTQEAKKRLALQSQLFELCFSPYDLVKKIKSSYMSGTDLDFTYDANNPEEFNFLTYTAKRNPNHPKEVIPLMIISLMLYSGIAAKDRDFLFDFLSKNSDINATNNDGMTALMFVCSNSLSSKNTTICINELSRNPKHNINQQDLKGNTALMYLVGENAVYYNTEDVNSVSIATGINDLINTGADPEIANFAGTTPLQALLQAPNQDSQEIQEAIVVLKEAIAQKYIQKK
jgi:hypothetical protein